MVLPEIRFEVGYGAAIFNKEGEVEEPVIQGLDLDYHSHGGCGAAWGCPCGAVGGMLSNRMLGISGLVTVRPVSCVSVSR
jgi:hypothetical protein